MANYPLFRHIYHDKMAHLEIEQLKHKQKMLL